MMVFRYLKRDLQLGLFSRIYMMLVPILFAVLQSRECSHAIAYFQQEGIMSAKGSCVDYIMYVFQGMHIFSFRWGLLTLLLITAGMILRLMENHCCWQGRIGMHIGMQSVCGVFVR